MKISNEYGNIVHQPTNDFAHEISNLVEQHLRQLLDYGFDLSDVRLATHLIHGNISAASSDVVLSHQFEISNKKRFEFKKKRRGMVNNPLTIPPPGTCIAEKSCP
jgi:hypothetical protein